jgi:O-acetyl-ADP-ribose deacetylase (regulator of RNase III)
MKIIKGDLIELARQGKFDIVVHGCNCFHMMGAGIAKQIAKEFPAVLVADKKTERGSIDKLGDFSHTFIDLGDVSFNIFNAYTQHGTSGYVDVFEYEAFQKFLNIMKEDFSGHSIGFPWIGCGLAGGNKAVIQRMMEETLAGMDVTIVEFE